MTQTNVVIIGNGRFGKYLEMLINKLDLNYSVFIGNSSDCFPDQVDLAILAVPISNLKEAVEENISMFGLTVTLVDVCSVKEYSQKLLQEANLPCTIINTHPMFGPQSAPSNCLGQRIVVCSKTNSLFDDLFFNELGLCRIDATAEEHDRAVASSQVINHLVGRAAVATDIKRTKFATATHEKFMDIVDLVAGNDVQLFHDMFRYNRYATRYAEQFLASLSKLVETTAKQ